MFYTLSCVVQFKLRIPQLKDFLGNLDKHFLEGINDLIEHKYFLKVHAPETLQTTISNRPMRICSKAASMTCKCCELQSMNNCFHSLTVIFPFQQKIYFHFNTLCFLSAGYRLLLLTFFTFHRSFCHKIFLSSYNR